MSEIILPKSFKSDISFFTLDNGVKVGLVSDNHFTRSFLSLSVKAGSFCNPVEIPGLAHFCEHMLFLGTEKYPDWDYYMKYLNSHGGEDNAYTDKDKTQYHFEVDPEFLDTTAEIFSQFFVSPLFSEEGTEREIQAIENEFMGNKMQDNWRLFMLMRSLSNPEHPYSYFSTGNRETLTKISVPELSRALRDYFNEYYSSDNMYLAIIGPQSIAEMTEIAKKYFTAIPKRGNGKLFKPEQIVPPYRPCDLGKIVYITPVAERDTLMFMWQCPEIRSLWKESPDSFISSLVGDETEGSILYLLKKKGWATSLESSFSDQYGLFGMFSVRISLTNEGMDHREDVMEIVYQYLNMLQTTEPNKALYEERNNQDKINFYLKSMVGLESYEDQLVNGMVLELPKEYIIVAGHYSFGWDPENYKRLLSYLKPENCLICVSSKKVESLCDKKERWYEVAYHDEKLSPELFKRLSEARVPVPPEGEKPVLHVPNFNEFISILDECVNKMETREEELLREPENIGSKGKCEWFCFEDHHFGDSKVMTKLRISSPLLQRSVRDMFYGKIFFSCLEYQMNEMMYFGLMAGLNASFSSGDAMTIEINGLRGKYDLFAKRVLERFRHEKIEKETYDVVIEQSKKSLLSWFAKQCHVQVMEVSSFFRYEKSHFLPPMYGKMIESATFEDLLAWIDEFWSTGFYIKALTLGNYTIEEDKKLRDITLSILDVPSIPEESVLCSRHRTPVGKGPSVFNFKAFGPDGNNVIWNYYHFTVGEYGVDFSKKHAEANLLAMIMTAPCYNELRTNQQLCYLLWLFSRSTCELFNIQLVIRSSTNDPQDLCERADKFFVDFLPTIESLSEEELEEVKRSAIKKMEAKHLNSSEWFDDIYSEISSGCYRWTRVKQYVKAIQSIKKEDLIAAYKRNFIPSPDKDNRDVMSFRLYANPESLPPEKTPEFIEPKDFEKVRESIPVLESTTPVHWYY